MKIPVYVERKLVGCIECEDDALASEDGFEYVYVIIQKEPSEITKANNFVSTTALAVTRRYDYTHKVWQRFIAAHGRGLDFYRRIRGFVEDA